MPIAAKWPQVPADLNMQTRICSLVDSPYWYLSAVAIFKNDRTTMLASDLEAVAKTRSWPIRMMNVSLTNFVRTIFTI